MKKAMTRIAACSLAVLIAFGSVGYKPPKARAFGVESAFAAAATFSYLEAVGMSFEGSVYDGMRDSLLDIFVDLSDNFVSGLGILRSDFEAIVAEGVDFLENGHIRISSAAANMLGQFSDWLVDKLGLLDDNGVPVELPVSMISVHSVRLADGTAMPFLPAEYFDMIGDSAYDMSSYELERKVYNFVTGYSLSFENGEIFLFDSTGSQVGSGFVYFSDAKLYLLRHEGELMVTAYSPSRDHFMNGTFIKAGSISAMKFDDVCGASFVTDVDCSVGLSADYEAPPKVEEQYSMVIDTGMTIADEQSFIDAVLGGVVSGSFAPTYTIEIATGGDVVVPDEDTDTQAGILGWVKTIAQRVSAIPQSIAEAVKGIFVPDAALTTQITDAFAAKFSFVPTLHRLGTDLLSIGPDSKPPVVYIHLEDAEGTIDYGGTVKALDMSWYERYKEDGDRIIGGFLWLGFLWLLFKRVPAIINGGEMVQEYTADIDRGSKRRKQ